MFYCGGLWWHLRSLLFFFFLCLISSLPSLPSLIIISSTFSLLDCWLCSNRVVVSRWTDWLLLLCVCGSCRSGCGSRHDGVESNRGQGKNHVPSSSSSCGTNGHASRLSREGGKRGRGCSRRRWMDSVCPTQRILLLVTTTILFGSHGLVVGCLGGDTANSGHLATSFSSHSTTSTRTTSSSIQSSIPFHPDHFWQFHQ